MSHNESLHRCLQQVADEKSFLQFIESLGHDRADEMAKEAVNPSSQWGSGANGWQNCSIEDFLLAAVGWAAASSNGLEPAEYRVPSNPRKRCAEILYAGKIYE